MRNEMKFSLRWLLGDSLKMQNIAILLRDFLFNIPPLWFFKVKFLLLLRLSQITLPSWDVILHPMNFVKIYSVEKLSTQNNTHTWADFHLFPRGISWLFNNKCLLEKQQQHLIGCPFSVDKNEQKCWYFFFCL